MFGSFLPDLLLFAAGQASAWFYLRTGRFWFGFLGTALLWTLLDAWLLWEFVFVTPGDGAAFALLGLRAVAVVLVAWLGVARWRRRWSAAARQREARFAAGTVAFLHGDLAAAQATFTGLVRTDPWDAMAWIWLGDVLQRAGAPARAKRCYRRAASVDTARACADLLQLGRLSDLTV